MSQRVRFALLDSSGEPVVGGSPLLVAFRNVDGTEVEGDWPAVEEVGGGFYEFSLEPDDEAPVAYVVSCGEDSAVPFLCGSAGPVVAFAMYDESGDLDDSRTPVFSTFSDGEGVLTPPEIDNLGGGLYGFWPTPSPGKIVQYVVGDSHNVFWGTVGSVQLTNAVPAPESDITNTTPVTFDVRDSESFLGRVLVAVEYPSMGGATELVWDGSGVCGTAFEVTRVAISDGWRYTVLRRGGWPASPKLRVFLTNFGGREL